MSGGPFQIEVDTANSFAHKQVLAKSRSKRTLAVACIAAFAISSLISLMYRPFSQPESGDNAIWDYVAQCIVRGQVPYRDVIEIKTPGSAYLSALAMLSGNVAGLDDVRAVRVLNILLVGVLGVTTLLVARAYLHSLMAGFIAVLLLVNWPGVMVMMVAGTRPKVPMIIFGLLALLLIAIDKPFWAGFSSMLSCLCWQPGLLFTLAALLIFSKYLTTWRDLRAFKVIVGAVIPLVVVLVYFFATGALLEFWRWTVEYNYLVYLPEGREPASVALGRLWYLGNEVTGERTLWVKLAGIGALIYAVECIWRQRSSNTRLSELFKDALIIVPLLFLVFKTINYAGNDDLIPLVPFVGLFAGHLFIAASRLIAGTKIVERYQKLVRVVQWTPLLPIGLLMISGLVHATSYRVPTGESLQDQQRMTQPVADLVSPDDKIYVHGTLELLVLLHRANMNRYIFLDRGKDTYIGDRTPGGIGAIIDQMKSQNPKVISISRIRNVGARDELLDWAAARYDRFPVDFAHNSVYVRRVP